MFIIFAKYESKIKEYSKSIASSIESSKKANNFLEKDAFAFDENIKDIKKAKLNFFQELESEFQKIKPKKPKNSITIEDILEEIKNKVNEHISEKLSEHIGLEAAKKIECTIFNRDNTPITQIALAHYLYKETKSNDDKYQINQKIQMIEELLFEIPIHQYLQKLNNQIKNNGIDHDNMIEFFNKEEPLDLSAIIYKDDFMSRFMQITRKNMYNNIKDYKDYINEINNRNIEEDIKDATRKKNKVISIIKNQYSYLDMIPIIHFMCHHQNGYDDLFKKLEEILNSYYKEALYESISSIICNMLVYKIEKIHTYSGEEISKSYLQKLLNDDSEEEYKICKIGTEIHTCLQSKICEDNKIKIDDNVQIEHPIQLTYKILLPIYQMKSIIGNLKTKTINDSEIESEKEKIKASIIKLYNKKHELQLDEIIKIQKNIDDIYVKFINKIIETSDRTEAEKTTIKNQYNLDKDYKNLVSQLNETNEIKSPAKSMIKSKIQPSIIKDQPPAKKIKNTNPHIEPTKIKIGIKNSNIKDKNANVEDKNPEPDKSKQDENGQGGIKPENDNKKRNIIIACSIILSISITSVVIIFMPKKQEDDYEQEEEPTFSSPVFNREPTNIERIQENNNNQDDIKNSNEQIIEYEIKNNEEIDIYEEQSDVYKINKKQMPPKKSVKSNKKQIPKSENKYTKSNNIHEIVVDKEYIDNEISITTNDEYADNKYQIEENLQEIDLKYETDDNIDLDIYYEKDLEPTNSENEEHSYYQNIEEIDIVEEKDYEDDYYEYDDYNNNEGEY